MSDFSEAEIGAIENIFPDCSAVLCDFHREQCWYRWVSKTENGVSHKRDQVLKLLRSCAHATTLEKFDEDVDQLEASDIWKAGKLKTWFSKKWLPEYKRWIWACRRDQGLIVNTNNGLERINQTFKYSFLQKKRQNTLSQMIGVLVTEYIPDMLKDYARNNALCDVEIGRVYSAYVPEFLQNRPPQFVRECMARMDSANGIPLEDIISLPDGCFQSQEPGEKKQRVYAISINASGELPSCQCHYWEWNHRPCKHMFALLHHGKIVWDDFPASYRDSAYFVLDDILINSFNSSTQYHGSRSDTCGAEFEPLDEPSTSTSTKAYADLSKKSQLKCDALKMASLAREKLAMLRDSTYLCKDPSALKALCQSLDTTKMQCRCQSA